MTHPAKIGFLKARWHSDIVDQAYHGFVGAAPETWQIDAFDLPGAFELPLRAKRLATSGRYDAIVAAALVVDGGIYRHDFVANAVVQGLMQVMLETEVPVFSVSLTPHHFHEGQVHHAFFHDHFLQKGREAAEAVQMVLEDARLTHAA